VSLWGYRIPKSYVTLATDKHLSGSFLWFALCQIPYPFHGEAKAPMLTPCPSVSISNHVFHDAMVLSCPSPITFVQIWCGALSGWQRICNLPTIYRRRCIQNDEHPMADTWVSRGVLCDWFRLPNTEIQFLHLTTGARSNVERFFFFWGMKENVSQSIPYDKLKVHGAVVTADSR